MRCFADISAINRKNKARYSSIIVCITFAQYCTPLECTVSWQKKIFLPHSADHIFSSSRKKNLLLNESLTTPRTNKLLVVKGDETVGHLPRKFSGIVWSFLARSGEVSVEVIGRRWCGRTEVPWQFQFNSSNKVQVKHLKEQLASKSRV